MEQSIKLIGHQAHFVYLLYLSPIAFGARSSRSMYDLFIACSPFMTGAHSIPSFSEDAPLSVVGTARPPRSWLPHSPVLYQFMFDTVAFVVSFVVYYFMRFQTGWFATAGDVATPFTLEGAIAIGLPVLVLYLYWTLLFWFSGLYENWYVRSPFDEFFRAVRITFTGCCVLGVAIVLDDVTFFTQNSRLLMLLYWLELTLCVSLGRIAARTVQRSLRRSGAIRIPVLLVGSADKLRELLDNVRSTPAFGYAPLGTVLRSTDEAERWKTFDTQLAAVGTVTMLGTALDMFKPQEVLVSIATPDHEETLRIGAECDERGVRMKIVPDLYEIFSGQAHASQMYGMPLIEVSQKLMPSWEEALKRLLDIVFSLCALVLGLPFWCVVAAIIKLESPGPALYSQERVGRYGRPFVMYKFRSMRTDAEKDGPQWARKHDARVTRVGRFIRKTHIDEIPQFWNILKGDMSLVGPRPERQFFIDKYSKEIPYLSRRLKVRPGLTGWYQVHFGEQEETIEYVKQRLRMDFFYIENMSLKLDIEIILRTVVRVLRGSGTA
jgi:exopolysaccharide biosynthesis polyprenyl glycosylphosphotransferase